MKTPNFSRYQVRSDSTITGVYGWILKPAPNTQGYLCLKMMDDSNNLRNVTVHRIVAATYLGLNYSDSHIQVDHIDGDKLNNRIENLRLVTNIENTRNHIKLTNSHIPDGCSECKMCFNIKPRSSFDKSKRNTSGCQSYCKECRKLKYLSTKANLKMEYANV